MRIQLYCLLLLLSGLKIKGQNIEKVQIFSSSLPELYLDIANSITISSQKVFVKESFGFFKFRSKQQKICNNLKITAINSDANFTKISGELCGCNALIYIFQKENSSKISIKLSDSSYNRISIQLKTPKDENLFGLGQQHSYVNLKGKKIPIWVQEQGIGAGDQPISTIANIKMAAGSPTHSYAPIPFYISSSGYSVQLMQSQRSIFDFRKKDETYIEVWDHEMELIFQQSEDPLKLLAEHSLSMGRPTPLPDWAFGNILGLQGGTDDVNNYIRILENKAAKISAVWVQDWVGRKRTYVGDQLRWYWEADQNRYPDLKGFIQKLNNKGIAVLGYINPMMINAGPLYEEANNKGFFVKNHEGKTYIIKMTGFEVGLFDLTNPEARIWVKNLIKNNLIATSFEGWMADFGEALPWDAVLFSGVSAEEYHNLYPVEWAKLNREAIQEAGKEGQIAFFSRSAFEGSAQYSSFFWAGDQMTSWQKHDGIKSIVPALLSSGISGICVNHADVGAFAGFWKLGGIFSMRRTEKLLKRHIELGAFSPVFRTHEGILPKKNIQVYSNDKIAEFYTKFAKIREGLLPYLRTTEKEAVEKGFPMVRHPYLHYPKDKNCFELKYQFMLGNQLMVCPQLKKYAKTVRFYLPEGRWKHYFNGKFYQGGAFYKIKTPIGEPAVFERL